MLAGLVFGVVFSDETQRFHQDSTALTAATVDGVRAIVVDDIAATRKALDRMEKLCRRVPYEARVTLGAAIVNADRAFHIALDRARESSAAGDGDGAFESFAGVQKICRVCHQFAREGGKWPEAANSE